MTVSHLLQLDFIVTTGPYRSVQIPIQHMIVLTRTPTRFLVVFTMTGIDADTITRRQLNIVKSQEMRLAIIGQIILPVFHLKEDKIVKITSLSCNQYQVLAFIISGVIKSENLYWRVEQFLKYLVFVHGLND